MLEPGRVELFGYVIINFFSKRKNFLNQCSLKFKLILGTLHYNTKKSIMTKIRKSLTLKRSNSQRNSADNSKEVTANQWDGKMIAVKFGINYIICKDELDKYFKFNAKNNPAVEFYGIPALYFIGVVMGQHPTFGLTMFEESIDKRFQRPASLSELNLLCMLYQAVRK